MADGREILLEVRMTFGREPHLSICASVKMLAIGGQRAGKEEPLNDLTLTLARLGRPQHGGRKNQCLVGNVGPQASFSQRNPSTRQIGSAVLYVRVNEFLS